MKNLLVILFFVLTLFTVPISAQQEPSGMGMPAPGIIARPSFETIEGGLELKIWIMGKVSDATEIDSEEAKKNTSDTDEHREGTHHIMVEVSDAVEGTEIADATVKVEILSPTGKTDIVDLESMMHQFGGNLPLDEKGEYKIKLNITADNGRMVKVPFRHNIW